MGCPQGCATSPGKRDSRRSQLISFTAEPPETALGDALSLESQNSTLQSPGILKGMDGGDDTPTFLPPPPLPPCTPHASPREVYSKTFQPELRGLGKERRDPGMELKLWRGCPPPQPQVTIGTEAKGCHHLNPQPRVPSPCGMLLMFCASILWVSALLHFFTTTPHSRPGACRVPQVLGFPAHLKSKVNFLEDDGSGRGGLLA